MFIGLVAAANIVFDMREISIAVERVTLLNPAEASAENIPIVHEMILVMASVQVMNS